MAVKPITRDNLRQRLESGEDIVVIEALPPEHFAEQHLPGAINITVDDVDAEAARLLPDTDATIVVYCADLACQMSTDAARKLDSLGYTNVFDYEAGKADWVNASLPTER